MMMRMRYALLLVVLMAAVAGAGALPVPEPIVLKKDRHEEAQFGYKPEYVCNVPSFDSKNRPYIRSRGLDLHETGYFHTLRDGKWVKRSFVEAVKAKYPDFERFDRGAGWYYTHAVFDDADRMYSLVQVRRQGGKRTVCLLYSTDFGRMFQCYDLPGTWPNIELRNDSQPLAGPPLIATLQQLRKSDKAKWGAFNRMMITQPKVTDKGLEIPKPMVATEACIGMCEHSGGASFVATIGSKSFIAWGEITEDESLPGVPTMVAEYDRETGKIGRPMLVGYAKPLNDSHNGPGICADSKGRIHVVTGAHGDHFFHYISKKPADLSGGFEPPLTMLDHGFTHPNPAPKYQGRPARQTYLGLVCAPDDTLHAAFRWWICEKDDLYHPNMNYAALGYQSKPGDGPWTDARKLIVAVADGYSNYHAKLAVDRKGRLYISYTYFNKQPHWVYGKKPSHYNFPAILTSGDGGKTWELAETAHFAAGIDK